MLFDWLAPLLETIKHRQNTAHSWLIPRKALDENLNLDIKNPVLNLNDLNRSGDISHLASYLRSLAAEADAIQIELSEATEMVRAAPLRCLGELTSELDERIGDAYTENSKLLGVSAEEGICQPKGDIGKSPGRYKILRTGYLAYNPMRINIGSIGVLRDGEQSGITSPDYVVFFCNPGLLPEYVYHYLRSEAGQHAINQKTKGSVRFRLYYEQLSSIGIPLPAERDQKMFATACNRLEMLRRRVAEAGLSVTDCLSTATRAAFLRP